MRECDAGSDNIYRHVRAEESCRRKEVRHEEYDFSKLKELKNPYARKKKAMGINLSPEVVDYFKRLAEETGLPYQKLIDLFLLGLREKTQEPDHDGVVAILDGICHYRWYDDQNR
jgi:predicted DNA binding CopG/RHH family protein